MNIVLNVYKEATMLAYLKFLIMKLIESNDYDIDEIQYDNSDEISYEE